MIKKISGMDAKMSKDKDLPTLGGEDGRGGVGRLTEGPSAGRLLLAMVMG